MTVIQDFYTPNLVRRVITKNGDYTVTSADRGQMFNMSKSSAIVLTLPADAAQDIRIGSEVQAYQGAAGQVTFASDGTSIVLSDTGLFTTAAQNSLVTARKVAVNTWLLFGSGLSTGSNVLASDNTVNDVTNTASKTTLWSFSVAANRLGTDKQIAIELDGDFLQNAASGTRSYTLEVKLGSTILFSDLSATETQNGTRRNWLLRLKLSNVGGVTNAQYLSGFFVMGASIVGAGGGIGDIATFPTATTGALVPFNGASAEDSTTALTLTISITWGSAATTLSFKRQQAKAYLLGEGLKGDAGPTGATGATGGISSPCTALTNSGGTVNVDCSLGNYFSLLGMSANVSSLTFSNIPVSGQGTTLQFWISQDATGGRTFALPSSFKKIGTSNAAIGSAANARTLLIISTIDGGATWLYSMQTTA